MSDKHRHGSGTEVTARIAVFVTTNEGCVAEPVSNVSTLPALLVIVQDWLPEVSPNRSVPMLGEVSSVTVRLERSPQS